MRALALVVAFAIGLVSGMVIELPEISESTIIDNEIEVRRRIG
jgi:hypothetical protein